jgi:phage regulator Rha-like protein
VNAIPEEKIERLILSLRGRRVMLDATLAELYEVTTKNLNKAVQRNIERFPGDFMFQLTNQEVTALRFQFGTSNTGRGGRRYFPYAFTEHGILMLSSVLSSDRAVQVNISIMRAFIRLRELVTSHEELARKLNDLEKRYDAQFRVVFASVRELIEPTRNPKKRRIGF